MAHGTGAVSGGRLLRMVTTEPAAMLGLEAGCGRIQQGGPADLTVFATRLDTAQPAPPGGDDHDPSADAGNALLRAHSADLALVLNGGRPTLADPELSAVLELGPANARVDDTPKWLIGDPRAVRARIAAVARDNGSWDTNPVWQRLQAAPG